MKKNKQDQDQSIDAVTTRSVPITERSIIWFYRPQIASPERKKVALVCMVLSCTFNISKYVNQLECTQSV